jgi:hypothetical protein
MDKAVDALSPAAQKTADAVQKAADAAVDAFRKATDRSKKDDGAGGGEAEPAGDEKKDQE